MWYLGCCCHVYLLFCSAASWAYHVNITQVYGRYSKVKKYAKVFRKWAIKEKLANAEARLVTWLNSIWEFVRDHSVRKTRHAGSFVNAVASEAPFALYLLYRAEGKRGTSIAGMQMAPWDCSHHNRSLYIVLKRVVAVNCGSFTYPLIAETVYLTKLSFSPSEPSPIAADC